MEKKGNFNKLNVYYFSKKFFIKSYYNNDSLFV